MRRKYEGKMKMKRIIRKIRGEAKIGGRKITRTLLEETGWERGEEEGI